MDPWAFLGGYQAFVAVADDPTWTGVILAALGSSAVGAIVGGVLTTSLRGRIERDEAWRTRLLDSVAELGKSLSLALASGGKITNELRRGVPADEVSRDQVAELRAALVHARTALVPVGLLFTRASPTFESAYATVRLLRDVRRILEGDMNRVLEAEEWAPLGITAETDPADAAIALFEQAQRRSNSFADSANDHIRSAHLRPARRRSPDPLRHRG